jgi:trk system potassium uptake protein
LTLLIVDERFGLLSVLFETVSAFGTVGLSTGITPQLGGISKVVIILVMYAGRIGTATVFSLVVGRRRTRIEPAEEGILIG